MQILEQYGRTLGSLDRPILQHRGDSISTDFLTQKDFYNILVKFQYNGAVFDRMFFTDPFASEPSIIALSDALAGIMTPQKDAEGDNENISHMPYTDLDKNDDKAGEEFSYECPLAAGWKVVISQRIPCHGQRISELVRKQVLSPESLGPFRETIDKMEAAEQEFFGDRDNPLFSWDGIYIANIFRKRGFTVRVASQVLTEKRRITPAEIEKWFTPESSAYGAKMSEACGNAELQKIVNLLLAACDRTIFEWKSEIAFFTIEK